jgi:multidrug resistance efflux pump
VSYFPDLTRIRRFVPGRPFALGAGAALALIAFLGLRGRGSAVSGTVTVMREDLVQTVEVEGELQAVRSTEIGVPPVGHWDFKIAFMAPEGTVVKRGTRILAFDTEALQRQLIEKQAEYQEAAKKVEQKQIDLGLKLLEIEQQSAQAAADLGKAKLQAEVPPEVQQRIELLKAQLDQKGRERDLENLTIEKSVTESVARSELRSLVSQRDRAQGRVEELQKSISQMTVLAPQDGIVVYRTDWQDRKKKVGDSMWLGETALSLPDLAEMRAAGTVDEADGGPVAEGQKVTLRLEARPDLDIRGAVRTVGRTVKQKSWRTPVKVFKVEVALDKTDPTVMRPAMRFRGEIETGRVAGRLLAPREAVFLRADGPVVFVRRAFGFEKASVTLGRKNRRQVEILSGLRDGDVLSPIDLEALSSPMALAAAGQAR